MTTSEKILTVRALIDDLSATDEIITVYLNIAESKILKRRFPFGTPDIENPLGEYEMMQCELASRLYFRRGAEGETGHNENGVNRLYGSANDEDLLCEVMQVVL